MGVHKNCFFACGHVYLRMLVSTGNCSHEATIKLINFVSLHVDMPMVIMVTLELLVVCE